MKELQFWYEFASPYSYISMMRIGDIAEQVGVEVHYQPFLLGPIFKDFGWELSPFITYPEKGRYFFRDIQREAAAYGLPLTMPAEFPQRGLLAARTALVGMEEGWGVAFSQAVYVRQFSEGLSISGEEDIGFILESMEMGEVGGILARAQSDEIKGKLFKITDQAKALGIIGAPSFIAREELFWGNDRLERAFQYALGY
ncbi:MAG: 2-hydroxychromene-2-carboxylate isomerase [Rhodomicrobium sp.]|nr:MAG: 2-hydroxychromene-2-carboxylate isomerase [Rhodomicrobium sp.]